MSKILSRAHSVMQTANGDVYIVPESVGTMLRFIQQHPECLYEEVSEHCNIEVQTVRVYAGRLAKAGLIERPAIKMEGHRRVMLKLALEINMNFNLKRI